MHWTNRQAAATLPAYAAPQADAGPPAEPQGRKGAGAPRPEASYPKAPAGRGATKYQGGNAMLDNSVLAGEIIRHGAYVCLRLANGADARALAAVGIPAGAEELGLGNEFGARPAGTAENLAPLPPGRAAAPPPP